MAEPPGVVRYPDGLELPAVPFGMLQEEITTAPAIDRAIWRSYWKPHDPTGEVRRPKAGELCHDCDVAPGTFHEPGCDAEHCPRCAGQLIGCGCLSAGEPEDDGLDVEDDGDG